MTTLLDKFKTDVPIISDGFRDLASKISKMTPDDYPKKWLEWAKSFDVTDKSAVQFFKDVDALKRKISDIDDYMNSASNATSKFASSLKSVAANIGIMLAVNLAIKATTAIWDEMNVTVAETQEKINELNSSLDTLNSEYETLSSRDADSLSQSEKDRLQYLEDRIALEERLLEIEQAKQVKEQVGTGFTDYFDKDSLRGKEAHLKFYGDGLGEEKSNIGIYENLSNETEELKRKLEELSPYTREYQETLKTIDSNNKTLLSLEDKIIADADNVFSKIDEAYTNAQIAQDALNSGYLKGDEKKEAEYQYEYWSSIAESYEKLYNRMTNVTHKAQTSAESISERLDGIISVDELKSNFSSEDLELLTTLKFDKNASLEELQAILEEAKKEVDETGNLGISDLLNKSDYAETKEKLLDLAKSGELTAETLSSTEEYNKLLTATKTSAESAKNEILDMLSAQEKLSAASQGLNKLKSLYEEFKDIGFVTAETISALPETFKNLPKFDLFAQIVGDPTSGADAIQQAFNDIVKSYLLAQNTLSGLVGASDHEIQSYIANLKRMGISNAEDIVNVAVDTLSKENELVNKSEQEYYNRYLLSIKNKEELDTKYLNSSTSNNNKLLNALGEAYQTDYNNWTDLLEKKAKVYNKFVEAIGGSYDSSHDVANNLYKNNGANPSSWEIAEAESAKSAYYQAMHNVNKAENIIKLDLAMIETDFGDYDSLSSSSSSADPIKDVFEAEYNLLKHKLEMELITEEEYYHAVNALNQKYYAGKEEYLDEYRKYVEEVYKGLKQVQDDYLSDAKEEISHYENLDKYIGSEVEHVQKLRNAYETYADDQEERWEAEEEMYKLREQYMERWLSLTKEIYNEPLDLMSSYKDELQSYIDVIESEDVVVGESIYNALIDATKMEIDTYQQRRAEISKQIENGLSKGLIEEGDTNWYELQQQINECDRAILDSTVSLNEFQDALIELDWSKFDELAEKIDNVNTQLDELQNVFGDKDRFNDDGTLTNEGLTYIAMVLQERENSLYKLAEIQEELNDLENQYGEGLISQNEYVERYNELLEMQWDSLKAQLDAESALIDLKKQEYQEQIDALQESANEEDRLYQLEKARYELERAKNQKNHLYFNGSEYVYQADQDVIRDAENNLRDLELENTIKGLQDLIDELENGTVDIGELLTNTIDLVNQNASTVYGTLMDYSVKYGITIDDNVIQPWNNATNTLTQFGKKVTDVSSVCTIRLSKVKREISNIRNEANQTATSIVNMLKPDFENIEISLVDVASRIMLINSAANGAYEAMEAFNYMDFSKAYSTIDKLISKLNSIPKSINIDINTSNGNDSNESSPSNNNPNPYWAYKSLGSYNTYVEASSKIGMLGGNEVIKIGGNTYLVVKWLKGFATSGEASSQLSGLGGSGVYKRYTKGGVISGYNSNITLDDLAHAVGEDTMIAAKYGERVLSERQTKTFDDFVYNTLPNLERSLKNPNEIILQRVEDSLLTKTFGENFSKLAEMSPIQYLSNIVTPNIPALANVQPCTETTTLQFNGDLSFPNIQSGNDAEKFINSLKNLKNDARQYANKRY